ncbi:MAG: hypothetical protein ACXWQE_13090 [Bdellovibrionales bacterium]
MKKILLSLSAVVLCLSTLAYAGTVSDPAILGGWISSTPIYSANGMTIYMAMNFQDSSAIMSSVCQFQSGQTLEAAVTVPVSVAANKINVEGTGSAENKSGGLNCNVNVQVGSVDYTVTGPTLTLNAGGRTLDFNRR